MPHGKPMHNFQLKRGYRANYACVDCGVEMIGDPRAQEPCRNSSAISIEAHAPSTPAPDWTVENSSPLFEALVSEVERLIRSEAHALISGDANGAARLIMAQLAHVHKLRPEAAPTTGQLDPNANYGPTYDQMREALQEIAAHSLELDVDEIHHIARAALAGQGRKP